MMTMEGREKAKAVLSLGDDRGDCQDLRVRVAIMDDKESHDVRRMEPVIRAGLLDQLLGKRRFDGTGSWRIARFAE